MVGGTQCGPIPIYDAATRNLQQQYSDTVTHGTVRPELHVSDSNSSSNDNSTTDVECYDTASSDTRTDSITLPRKHNPGQWYLCEQCHNLSLPLSIAFIDTLHDPNADSHIASVPVPGTNTNPLKRNTRDLRVDSHAIVDSFTYFGDHTDSVAYSVTHTKPKPEPNRSNYITSTNYGDSNSHADNHYDQGTNIRPNTNTECDDSHTNSYSQHDLSG
eukprot:PhF_6_TR40239/c2_g1_i1/m.59847